MTEALRRRHQLTLATLVAGLTLLALSWWGSRGDLASLVHGAGPIHAFLSGLWPPDLSASFLGFLVKPLAETLLMGTIGTLLAVALALPLALLATGRIGDGRLEEARSIVSRRRDRLGYHAARATLNALRAVPDMVWALLFVVMVGLGMVPGLLAIAVSYAGMLGKIYAEILEGMDARPLEALAATGAPRALGFLWGALPQAWPQWVSFTLYAWECAMRAAAVMGFVGAGGLGYQLDMSMRMFEYREAGTLLLALVLLIGGVDAVGAGIRKALLPEGPPRSPRMRRVGHAVTLAGAGALSVLAFQTLAQPLGELLSDAGRARLGRFLGGAFPPDLGPGFLATTAQAILETLSISVLGTAMGIGIGLLLMPWAARNHHGTGGTAWASRLGYTVSRWTLNVLRAIPEVFLALILVLAVGLGPFAGALALGLHTGGILGKLYADTLETADPRAFRALTHAGATGLSAMLYSTLPTSLPVLASHTLYRWEMNLRVSAVLGLVGGGGLGQALYNTMQLGFYDQLLTLILALYALVTLGDRLGSWARARLAGG